MNANINNNNTIYKETNFLFVGNFLNWLITNEK